ncbi:hypothetical protein KAU86_03545 [bacterium]|nr:hypothetical protein [bacterium]MCK4437002.1 hypothetical protein [bacterium]
MARIIKNVGLTQRQVNLKVVAKELGAEAVGVTIDTRQGPISLFALRQFLVERLRSSGGRPALVGALKKRRNKIPLFDEDWIKLEKIAKYYKQKEGLNVSPGQIASALVHTDVSRIDTSKIEAVLRDK